jgi:hypothetical protein
MSFRYCRSFIPVFASILIGIGTTLIASGQETKQSRPQNSVPNSDADHVAQRNKSEWFYRGRVIPGKPAGELRRRAYQAKLQMRAQHAAALAAARAARARGSSALSSSSLFSGSWTPLGPVPLASDATGNGTQNYDQVAGRATAVAIDPADPTGNTIYIGGAQSGVWQSTNAVAGSANSVTWASLTDDQATLSIGAIAIQPGNSNPANSLILATTGEADDSADSYFGLGILRSADGGSDWTLVSTANSGALSFAGLGGTRMAFSTATGLTSTVVAAMATSSEGVVAGAVTVTANSTPGLYTSLDAGQTWTYEALTDPGGSTDANSATSVIYNASAGLFFAALRFHGFYSSPDGVNWTRLAIQPGASLLTATACPPQSTSNSQTCPIFRGEITAIPGRNEMYVWFVYFSSGGSITDGGIWQSLNGGQSWTSISDAGIINCGDLTGCGVEQGSYNLELLAVPNASATDLYAGAVNLYKCSISTQNPTCAASSFINLTHVYGCDPISALAHVHPAQHALAAMIPNSGSDSGNALLYFANDGGIYRALNGFAGLSTGSCSGTNQFDDLNQNLGSMTQFVSFSQHPSDPDTLLGGAQDNGSPATNQATTNPAWINVLGGAGGYNAIDPNAPLNFYASNPDIPPGGLGIQLCQAGVNCIDSTFSLVVTSSTVGGDDGAFYFPYILDSQSTTALLVGTCRVWRGPRTGGTYTVLSPNFDTFGSGICSGSEVNVVSALAAGGPTDANGSTVIYATTSGLGPLDGPLFSPTGGHVWVTTNATAGPISFSDTTNNGPQGTINPNQFPISGVALDPADTTGSTAYITVMGFTAPPGSRTGPGHVWKTTNAGASWTDYTANLPDAPANAVVVDPTQLQVYVATDVGVFASSTSFADWTELGPVASPGASGFLPNVAVTALGIFNSGGEELLRASTYGRGIWQYGITAPPPNFQLSVSNSPQTVIAGVNAGFNVSATALNGYSSSISLSCVAAGTSVPPSPCTVTPSTVTPTTSFTVVAGAADGDGSYNFNLQAVGSDPSQTTHEIPLTLNVVSFGLTAPVPVTVTVPRGTTSSLTDFQATAAGSFDQTVTVSCNVPIPDSICTLTPGATVSPTAATPVSMTASVAVPAATATGAYQVTLQATAAGAPAAITTLFTLNVTTNADFILSEPSAFPEVNAGSTGTTGPISIASQDGFSGTVNLSCSTTFGAGSCSVSPTSVSSFPATTNLTINGTSFAAGSYSISVTGTSGSDTHSLPVAFNAGDYSITGTQSLALAPAGLGNANLTLTSLSFYSGSINATCNANALAGSICTISPTSAIPVTSTVPGNFAATISVPNNAAIGLYNILINTQDTTGAPSHSFTIALTVSQDFLVTPSPPGQSQTVTAGQTSGPYNLTVLPVGSSFNQAVTLSCSGLPALSQCVFNPPTPVTPNNTGVSVVMTITTTGGTAAAQQTRAHLHALWMIWPGLVLGWIPLRRRSTNRKSTVPALALLLLMIALAMPSCGGVSSGGSGGGGQQGTPPGTYSIIVTGTSGTPNTAGYLSHPAPPVTLIVNPSSASSTAPSGSWEFVATSNVASGSTTLIEANLAANGAQTSASGPSQVQTATYVNGVWYVDGACSAPSPGQNTVSGTASGNTLSFTFNEGGNIFIGQGTVTGNTISGTYSGNNPNCSDSGTFTGAQVPNLGGTFSGTLNFPGGSDQVTATLTEGANYSLTFQTTLSGTDNGNFLFSGSAVANVAFVSGSINGNQFSLFGYFDSSGRYTGTANSMAVFDYNTLEYEGLLVKQ